MRFQSLTKVHTVRIHVLLMPMLIMSKLKLKLSRVAADSLMDYIMFVHITVTSEAFS